MGEPTLHDRKIVREAIEDLSAAVRHFDAGQGDAFRRYVRQTLARLIRAAGEEEK